MSQPIPILFLGDGPDAPTGLGRITRDLASLVARMPEYRVATLGRAGLGSRHLPFHQYMISLSPLNLQWGEQEIEKVWKDWSKGERGVVMTIWDPSRLLWFARPEFAGDARLQSFLSSHHFARWGYWPIDSTGPGDKLTGMAQDVLLGYDRLLAYTKWADSLVRRSIGEEESERRGLTWLPHGINFDTFTPRHKQQARERLSPMMHEGDLVVGVVGTNQPRKDWGLAFATCASLRARHPRLRVWAHIDMLERHWSINALARDFGLGDVLTVTTEGNDTEMSWRYSACDITLAIGLGEGFGYPIAESLACGVPVVHGAYGGGMEITPEPMRVEPIAYRLDTLHNALRPVYEPGMWAERVEVLLNGEISIDSCRGQVAHLSWKNLWPACFKPWFLEGLKWV